MRLLEWIAGLMIVTTVSCARPAGGRSPRAGLREDAITPEAPFRFRAPTVSAERPFVMPKVRDERLANGLRFLLVENHELPMVAISVAVRRGAAAARPGLANLARALLDRGTEVRDGEHMLQSLRTIGAQDDGATSQSSVLLEYVVLPSGAAELLALLAEMLRRPDPMESTFEHVREWWLAQVRTKSPGERTDEAVAAALFPVGHPYRVPAEGTSEALQAFRKADAMAFLREHVAPDQIIIAAAGDVTWSTFSDRVKTGFADWGAKAVPEPKLPALLAPSADAPIIVVDRPSVTQTEIRIAALCPPRGNPDIVAFQLMSEALGGAFTSRIVLNLREKHGYSYTPHTTIEVERGPGVFTAIARVPAQRVAEALGEMTRELDRVGKEDLTTEELTLARASLTASFQGVFASRGTTASTLSLLLAHERPVDDYAQASRRAADIKPADVREVAQRYLAPSQRRIVIMGDAKVLRSQLAGRRIELWSLNRQ
jgi:zinc protease